MRLTAQTVACKLRIVNDGSAEPHRLVFSSTTTGTDAGITSIDFTGDLAAAMPAMDTATEIQAQKTPH